MTVLHSMTASMPENGGGGNREDKQEDIMDWFDSVVENAAAVQSETLRRILEINGCTEYVKKFLSSDILVDGMEPAALEKLYRSAVPLSNHSDIEPFIQRVADGDKSLVITRDPITTLSLRVYPIRPGGRVLEFIYSSKQFNTKGGLLAGTATTHYFASEEFKAKQRSTKTITCSPPEVISGGDYKQSAYCHLLLGLIFRDQIELLTSTFAYSIVQALSSLEGLWPELCEDIRQGTLSNSRVSSHKIRKSVLGFLLPDCSVAAEIEALCTALQRAGWRGTVPLLWPNAKYIYSIITGSMLPYLNKLRHYAGGLPLVCADYGSTESWIGVNIDPESSPETAKFTVVPTFAYFEFIPLYRRHLRDGENSDAGKLLAYHDFVEGPPVTLAGVKLGQQYELVLTTFTGLYRYRLGDVVEVSGFYKESPQLSFICRRKLILTINIDKNTEQDLQLAVEKGSRLLVPTCADLVDFTSHADMGSGNVAGHYVIYWEIRGEADDEVLSACCTEMDAAFADHGYVVSRKTGSIGPLELRIVSEGTFQKILDHYLRNGAAMSQFKTPRCTGIPTLLSILDCCTVKRFWSTAYV